MIAAIMGISSMFSGGFGLAIFALIALHLFDAYQGASSPPQRESSETEMGGFGNEAAQEATGPVMSFFTESWKVNSFNRKNYSTCQIVQILMIFGQLYFAIIAMVGGAPVGLVSVILGMIVAGVFSFFSPMRISAVDAAQSNGAQIAVLGAATHTIVTTSPTLSFYMLFCMLAADAMMSCSTFFQEH